MEFSDFSKRIKYVAVKHCNPLGESWGERSIAWGWLKTIIL